MSRPEDQAPSLVITAKLKIVVHHDPVTSNARTETLNLMLTGHVDHDGRVSVTDRFTKDPTELGSGGTVAEAVIDALDHLARRLAGKS